MQGVEVADKDDVGVRVVELDSVVESVARGDSDVLEVIDGVSV